MAPKKKTTTVIGSFGTGLPVPVWTSSGPVTERTRGGAREHAHHPGSPVPVDCVVHTIGNEPRGTGSRDGVGAPAGSAAKLAGFSVVVMAMKNCQANY